LRDADGLSLASNDNWADTQREAIEESGLAPGDSREAAIEQTLIPGSYTAIVSGKDGGIGVGLVEIYRIESDSCPAQRLAAVRFRRGSEGISLESSRRRRIYVVIVDKTKRKLLESTFRANLKSNAPRRLPAFVSRGARNEQMHQTSLR
jgi:hypothetical protein